MYDLLARRFSLGGLHLGILGLNLGLSILRLNLGILGLGPVYRLQVSGTGCIPETRLNTEKKEIG
jgi:hypothetical protein